MKKVLIITSLVCGFITKSQTVADFETFSLTANSNYHSISSTPFQTSNAVFEYEWDPSFGGFWAGGFSYTNKYDSANGTFANLFGVKPYKGYNNSATYLVAQDRGLIELKVPFKTVDGFYITNTTFAFKSIKNGNQFSRKFGDTTGTGSGTTIAQGSYPDYFKVTAKGYLNGTMKQDSSVFFLADYRFSDNTKDYVVNDWRWFNTSNLGMVDSIRFFMYSTDTNQFGMNTPAFFGIDNFTASAPNPTTLRSGELHEQLLVYPNPFSSILHISYGNNEPNVKLLDVSAREVFSKESERGQLDIDLTGLNAGIYFLQVEWGGEKITRKILKY